MIASEQDLITKKDCDSCKSNMAQEMKEIKEEIKTIKEVQIELKTQFVIVKNVVFGMVGLILVGFAGAIIALVIK